MTPRFPFCTAFILLGLSTVVPCRAQYDSKKFSDTFTTGGMGSQWADLGEGGSGKWVVAKGFLQKDLGFNPSKAGSPVIWNTAIPLSEDGTVIRASVRFSGSPAPDDPAWAGLAFGVQKDKPSDFYALRLKLNSRAYQVVRYRDNKIDSVMLMKDDAAEVFESDKLYEVTLIVEDDGCKFTIAEEKHPDARLNSVTSVSNGGLPRGGYAGLYAGATKTSVLFEIDNISIETKGK